MRITDIRVFPVSARIEKPIRTATFSYQTKDVAIVEVHTDEKVTGVGECFSRFVPEATKLIIEKGFKPMLIGEDPFDVGVLWRKMYNVMRPRGHSRGFAIEAISGIDTALWDIMGKALDMPLYKLLGGSFHKRIKVYASSIMLGETQDLVQQAQKYVDQGFRAIKMKIGYGIAADIEKVRAVRQAIGNDVDLMVDANCAYNVSTAIELGRKLEKCDIYWFEEPISPENVDGYVEVSKALDLPIAAGESLFTRYDFRDIIVRHAVDVIQPSIARAGGISEIRRIIDIASIYDVPIAPFTGLCSAVGLAATLHISASTPDFLIQELETLPNPLRENLLTERIDLQRDSYLEIPDKPGLGVEVSQHSLKEYSST
jgi:D-arabinonate dehydratase/D-galactarolactone cycloisomerase